MPTKLSIRRAGAAVLAALALAACSENGAGGGITPPQAPPVTPPNTIETIACSANVRARTVECGDAAAASGIRAYRTIGGQRLNVLMATTNVAYDSATGIFSADVSVKNLLPVRLGSDGTTVTGLKVYFASGPNVTGGSGVASVDSADGTDSFTEGVLPYYLYPGALPPDSTTAPRHWKLAVPTSVESFSFHLYVQTDIVPAIVFEMAPSGNRDIYRMGIDGNDLKKLSTSLLTDAQPTATLRKVVFTSYRDGNAELYSVSTMGGAETRLTNTATVNETNAALSPDASRLAWAQGASGGITKIFFGTAAMDSVAAATVGSGDAIESSPNWKSGTRLTFTSAAGGSADIYGVDLPALKTGGTASFVTGSSSADVEGVWDPDGNRMVFASNRSGDTELYMYTPPTGVLAGGTVTRLTTRAGSDGAPAWVRTSADRRKMLIVYTCVQGSTFRLCKLDPENLGAGGTVITTPYPADHASGIPF